MSHQSHSSNCKLRTYIVQEEEQDGMDEGEEGDPDDEGEDGDPEEGESEDLEQY